MEGVGYLADAAAYPQVQEYWEGVAAHLAAVEEVEDALYRAAYLEAADVLGVSGPLRSLRLARAPEDSWSGRWTGSWCPSGPRTARRRGTGAGCLPGWRRS